ncbi:MAG: amidinotransferase [Deltaproteobacteria bacterium]|nr:amidinotransferase [Deltaproteobacteria bacterium]
MIMRLLMCPPVYYGIEYEINPWMSRAHQIDHRLAQEQWRRLYRLLQDDLEFEISLAEPRPGLPDMVFTANAGVVWDNQFIASNFRHEVRRGEVPAFENWFRVRGYEVCYLPNDHFFEGEGDLLLCGDLLFAGYHIRSDILSHQKVAEILEREVLSLELASDWFYHLDTCFCPLDKARAIFYPPAFDAYALKVLENHIETLLPVTEAEARRFACNAIVANQKVVMNDGCTEIRARLESLGFTVYETPLSEFIKAGGSAKCLVLKVPHNQEPH